MTKQNIEYWVIPPECDAEFVAQMENELETYEKPYDSSQPVVCMDEQPVQLINETREVIPATKTIPDVLTTNTNAIGAFYEAFEPEQARQTFELPDWPVISCCAFRSGRCKRRE